MMSYKCHIGVDVSKGSLDIACLLGDEIIKYKCSNKQIDILRTFRSILRDLNLEPDDVLICGEYTGHYSNILVRSMVSAQLHLWMESPNQIYYSQGLQRGKNDSIDAERIALYCKRYEDRCNLMKPSSLCIENLAYLISERDLLVRDLAKFKSQITDHEGFISEELFSRRKKRLQKLIKSLKEHIKEIEMEMTQLVDGDLDIKHKMDLLQSIQGVGKQVALNTLIATKNFKKFTSARKFACHVGVAPFEYCSGSSIKSARRVSKRANKGLKALIHMAALSAVQREGELRDYYLRKVAEGKNKMLVINAVRAKIIARMFSVISNDRKYENIYAIKLA